MSADVLSPSKSRSTPNPSKAALTHLVGRPLVPFFDGDAEQTPPNYDPNDFAVPEHLKLASRKFVNGYWVNEDGSTAQIGENTPTLINATNAHNNNNNGVESQKSPQRTSSQPIHKSVNTPVNGQRAKHSKKQHSHHHAHNASNAHTNNSDGDVHSAGPAVLGPPAPAPSRSASDTKVQFSQSNKSNKHNKSIPSLSASTPSSLSYAAIVAKSSNSPSHVQQDPSSSNSGNEVETFQTPFKSKKQFNGTNSSNNGIHKIPAIVTNSTVNGNKTDKENFAALSSPAPNNIPMPKFLSSSSPPSFNSGNPSKSPSGTAALASAVNDLTSLTLNSPVATTNTTTSTIADSSASASVASLTSTNSSSSTLVENAEKGAQLLSLLKKGLSMNTDSNNSISAGLNLHTTTSSFAANGTAPTFSPNVYPSHYSYTYPYPAHNSAAPYPYAAAGYHPSYASAMGLSHHTHYPMQPSTAASLSAATSLPVAAVAPPSLMLLTNDGRAGGENSVKSVPINGSTTSPTLQSQPHHPHPNPNPSVQNHPYSFPMTHVHPYSSAAFHPTGHTHSLSSMNFSHAHGPPPASVYTHFSPPHAIPFNTLNSTSSALAASAVPFASSSVSSSSTSALMGQQYPAHGSPLAAPSH